jgi:ATP-dependent Clp protease adaptor protein ClpS
MSRQSGRSGANAAPSGLVGTTGEVHFVAQYSLGDNVHLAALESPVVEQETKEQEAVDIPWQVVVHNDPVNLMSYVTMVFQKVFGFTRERAEKHMLEVHHQGRSVVWSGLRERAELYVQQLHGYLLLATVERAN